jgi:hypothetical protein
MDPNSVAAVFCDMCIDDLCRICESDTALVLASASDKTLKEYTSSQFYREELVESSDRSFPDADIGQYQQERYKVMIQPDCQNPGGPVTKIFRSLHVAYSLGEATEYPTLCASVGAGFSPSCLEWEKARGMRLACGEPAGRRRAGEPATFNFFSEGIWLTWRLEMDSTEMCGVSISTKVDHGGCW